MIYRGVAIAAPFHLEVITMKIIDVTHTIPTQNYSNRKTEKEGICLHITTDFAYNQALNWFRNKRAKASAHYIVERNGDIFYCVNDANNAYHAGKKYRPTASIVKNNSNRNPNSYLMGIEVVAVKNGHLTQVQFKALKELVEHLCIKHGIPLDRHHIIGHNEINTKDKIFCPVSVYNPNEVIRSIKADREIKRLRVERKELAERYKNSEYDQDRIIKKVRRQLQEMRRFYQEQLAENVELRRLLEDEGG